jgi:hypothetical protein
MPIHSFIYLLIYSFVHAYMHIQIRSTVSGIVTSGSSAWSVEILTRRWIAGNVSRRTKVRDIRESIRVSDVC